MSLILTKRRHKETIEKPNTALVPLVEMTVDQGIPQTMSNTNTTGLYLGRAQANGQTTEGASRVVPMRQGIRRAAMRRFPFVAWHREPTKGNKLVTYPIDCDSLRGGKLGTSRRPFASFPSQPKWALVGN